MCTTCRTDGREDVIIPKTAKKVGTNMLLHNNIYVHKMILAAELLIGTALTAAAFGMIILPQGFAAAGVTGFARTITLFIPVPLSAMVFILNMLLMLLGLFFVGSRFVAKTIAVSILFPILMELFSRCPLNFLSEDTTLCTVLAGVMLGTGAGLILRSGASSGGFDILAVILNQKYKLPVATVMNICDVLVILMQALGRPILPAVYGILTITISAAIVSRVVTLGTGESQIMVFSDHYDEIRTALLHDLDAGMTFLNAETGFAHMPTKVIVSIVPYQKVLPVKRMITAIDPTAFVVVVEIRSVLGKGYTLDRHFNPPMLT